MTQATTASATWTGPVILSYGFRPFFLLAGGYAVVAMALWLLILAGHEPPLAFPAIAWHAHELLFGFAGAGLAGFLLTAVPNWTNRAPPKGTLLVVLVLLWLAGRLATTLGAGMPPFLLAALNLAFPLVLVGLAATMVIGAGNRRNYPVLVVLALFPLASLLTWAEGWGLPSAWAPRGPLLALFTLVILIGVIGGRIVPLFTNNWLAKTGRGAAAPPVSPLLDRASLAAVPLAAACEVLAPGSAIGGAVLVLAGALTLARLARWRGLEARGEALVAVLHLGYAWLGFGLVLLGLSSLVDAVPRIAGIHALTAGAIATMLVAVMTRASLGHTGRPLIADRATVVVYALVTAAAVVRVLSPWGAAQWPLLIGLSGALWIAGFALFTAHYWPVWTRARRG